MDLRESVGKVRKKSKADYYPELLFPFILSCDSSSLPALSACERLRDYEGKILTTELRLQVTWILKDTIN